VDGALGGALTLVQPRTGYRFSVDAVLLARFAAETRVSAVLDLGCGCGVVGLSLLALGSADRLEGVDIQPEMIACARESARRSRVESRAVFRVADFRERNGSPAVGGFPLVVSNPPYRPSGSSRVSPRPAVAVARHEVCGSVADLARAAAGALECRGRFCVVYPATRLPDLLGACSGVGLQPRVLRCVHPRLGEPARLVLLRCSKGGGEGLVVRPPLVLHGDENGQYSPEAASLLGPP